MRGSLRYHLGQVKEAMDRRLILSCGIAVFLCGCNHAAPPEFPNWLSHVQPRTIMVDPNNAYLGYVAAADEAERTGGKYLDKVSFTPGQKEMAMKLTEGALQKLVAASSKKCDFAFSPVGPFDAAPHQKGWRIIGRDLVWKIENAIFAEDYSQAVQYANVATKFGFDLTGGGATDASLGLAIVDEARKAVAPALSRMGAGQLGQLAEGTKRALETAPPMKVVIDNEKQNMLEAVQFVQDSYRSRNFDDIEKNLGSDIHNAVQYLKDIERKDSTKRPEYFQSLSSEAEGEISWMQSIADLPVAQRDKFPEPKYKGERPWRKFSRSFFYTLRPLILIHDEALARTRLLILEASVLQQVKAGQQAPKDLSAFPDPMRIDPYSGQPFVYRTDGNDYRVYSVGTDLRDDGGDTDWDTFSTPDLRLETGA